MVCSKDLAFTASVLVLSPKRILLAFISAGIRAKDTLHAIQNIVELYRSDARLDGWSGVTSLIQFAQKPFQTVQGVALAELAGGALILRSHAQQ